MIFLICKNNNYDFGSHVYVSLSGVLTTDSTMFDIEASLQHLLLNILNLL